MHSTLSRRRFLGSTTAAIATGSLLHDAVAADEEPIIDIHQHTHYHGRTDEQMIKHQRAMGVTTTILLPSGRPVKRASTHEGRSNGLAAKTGGNDTVLKIAKKYPKEYLFGANEVPDLPGMQKELEKYLKEGAVIIAEQKFKVECDSKYVWAVAKVAQEFGVPVLMHFQHNSYNLNFDRFHRTLEKFPEGQLYRPCTNMVGQYRQETRPDKNVPAGQGDPRRHHRQIALQLQEHVRRPLRGFRPQFTDP